MENNTRIAYDALCAEEQILLAQLARKHQMIEQLAEELGEAPPSLDIPLPMSEGLLATATGQAPPSFIRGRGIAIQPLEFYPLKLAKAVMSYLERTQAKAAPYPEILSALKQGGFQMKVGKVEEERIRLNLLKSTNLKLLPNDMFGLASLYEKGKRRGAGKKRGRKPNDKKNPVVVAKKTTQQKKETTPSEKAE